MKMFSSNSNDMKLWIGTLQNCASLLLDKDMQFQYSSQIFHELEDILNHVDNGTASYNQSHKKLISSYNNFSYMQKEIQGTLTSIARFSDDSFLSMQIINKSSLYDEVKTMVFISSLQRLESFILTIIVQC